MTVFEVGRDDSQFNLALTVTSGQSFRWHLLDTTTWFGVDGDVAYHVKVESDALVVSTNGSRERWETLFLQFDQRMSPASRSKLQPWSAQVPGLMTLACACPVETLFTFLCTVNNHLSRIRTMVQRLAALGEPMPPVAGVPWTRFPSIDALASLQEEQLRAWGFGYRARTIPRAAAWVSSLGSGWLHQLRFQSYESAHRELCRIPGVGAKVADCVCLYGLHFGQAVPIDTHLWQSLCDQIRPDWHGKSITRARYQVLGDHLRRMYGDDAGVAQLMLYYGHLQNRQVRASIRA